MTRPISPYFNRFFVTMLAFSTVPSFRFHAVGYRAEIEKCVSLDSLQKRREADGNLKFTEYVIRYFDKFFPKINIYKILENCRIILRV